MKNDARHTKILRLLVELAVRSIVDEPPGEFLKRRLNDLQFSPENPFFSVAKFMIRVNITMAATGHSSG
jgi:hypothetical protein